MDIKTILAKLGKGEALTDDEKKFVESYDPDKVVNDAAAAARKKAEAQAAELQKKLDEVVADAAAKAKAVQDKLDAKMTDAEKQQKAFEELVAKVDALEKAKANAEATAARMMRSQTIREAAKAQGINLAPNTVSEKLFFGMLEAHVGDVDVSDTDALVGSLQAFKKDNMGVIDTSGGGSGGVGKPGGGSTSGDDFTLEQRTADMKKRGLI